MFKRNHLFILIIILTTIIACQKKEEINFKKLTPHKSFLYVDHRNDTTFKIKRANSDVNVYLLANNNFFTRGTVILLHGWNLSPLSWCDQTSFCNELLSMGYHVIIPDMGKSVYASQYYPETVETMSMYPQLSFVLDTLLPFLQDSIYILNSSHNNYLIGYSMGARGALAIAENTENIFSRLVLISGEYDQTLMPEDNILTMYFGSYQQFPERWEGKDNLLRNIDKLNIPVLILHGQNDDVISAIQSDTLAKVLENKNKFYIKTIYNNYGHDFDFVQKTVKDVNVFLNKDFLPLN
ncbi:MAG: hypothetical protein PWQ43_879 [Rikenellaceae bacterium]|nr:hypothetical protein [Rikenellaceae bacterium]MDI3544787.1 hypothetical protein [Rikenellaceae bacterium]MDN5355937.1 hypothetical protein [Rikenellaceae bacterium]